MRIHATSLLMLLVMFAGKAYADARHDSARLSEVIAQIDRLLPAGWTVAFDVKNDRPKLVISSTEKLPVEYMGPGKSGNPEIDTNHQYVTADISFAPYVTPEVWAKTHRRNEELERQRRQYEETRLNQRQSRYKGGFTPATYERQTGDESPIIREYALFWMNTEPQPLPTHHCGQFSVVTYDLNQLSYPVKIHDERKDREFAQIIAGLEKIFVLYDVKPDATQSP
jgi:hypothetical protein